MQTCLLPALLLLLPVQVRPCPLQAGRREGMSRQAQVLALCPWGLRATQGVPGGWPCLLRTWAHCLIFPQYGLYVGEFLRGKPARERAQNGPDACAPLALPLGRRGLSPGEGGGTGAPSLSTPQTAAAGTPPPAFRALPLGLGPGRALIRGRAPLPTCN